MALATALYVTAELVAAAFLGIEVLAQNGRQIDLDTLATTLSAGVQLLVGGGRLSDG